MSYDEARRGFNYDAPDSPPTDYSYLLVGDNAYGYSTSGTNLSIPLIGDLDTYKIVLGVGTNYTILSSGTSPFGGTAVTADNFALLNRNGVVLALSSNVGSGFSAFTFTATDTLYYIQNYSSNPGYYVLRLENNTITEANGIGEVITAGRVYSAALDYVSDVDIYTFYAVAGVTYRATLVTSIPDIFLDVEYSNLAVDNLVGSSGIYTFTAAVTGYFNLHISSNSFVNTGAYTLITDAYNSYSSAISAINSIATTADGQYLLLKIGGVIYNAAIGSTLAFSDGSMTTGSLVSQYVSKVVPIFMSTGGAGGFTLPDIFTGPASLNLQYQLIESADNAVVIGSQFNDFIKVASANSIGKAVNGGGGNDVIDGGVGSTFVTGGGTTANSSTYFLDGRAPGTSWSTITDFKLDVDKATIWGFVRGVSSVDASFTNFNSAGAGGYEGLTLHFKNLLPSGQTSGTNANLNSITLSGRTLQEFGASSLAELNNQINNQTNPNFLVGATQDSLGTHGYLFIN